MCDNVLAQSRKEQNVYIRMVPDGDLFTGWAEVWFEFLEYLLYGADHVFLCIVTISLISVDVEEW